jgi:predicted house-cleaning noncanonical NTP pyrophosphatase (MazG superfamily)
MTKIHKFRFEKLVRDKAPVIMRSEGIASDMRIMEHEEYVSKLKDKILEEAKEVSEASHDELLEELADVLEVIHCLARASGFAVDDIERERVSKFEKRGGFEEKIYISHVTTERGGRLFDYMRSNPEKYEEVIQLAIDTS